MERKFIMYVLSLLPIFFLVVASTNMSAITEVQVDLEAEITPNSADTVLKSDTSYELTEESGCTIKTVNHIEDINNEHEDFPLEYHPPTGIRTPAEWERVNEVLLRWGGNDLDEFYLDMTREIAEVATAHIVTHNQGSANSIANYLENNGVNMDNVSFFIVSTNSIWMRDYGPISIINESNGELSFVNMMYDRYDRWEDDKFPWRYGQANSIEWFNMTDSERWFRLEGGNLIVDGAGIFYTTDRGFEQNSPPDGDLTEEEVVDWATDYFSLRRFRNVTRLLHDGHGHIDMQVKLLNETTVLIAETDPSHSDYEILERNARYFENLTARNGQSYNVVRIPLEGTYYTYVNSLIVNDKVLVPIYGRDTDSEALAIYQDAMPNHEIIGIDSSSIISSMGAIHCTTMQVAQNNIPPTIEVLHVHAPSDDNISIKAEIIDDTGVSFAHLYYNSSENETVNKVIMERTENDTYEALLPSFNSGTEIRYFIQVKDDFQALNYSGDIWDMHNIMVGEYPEISVTSPDGGEEWHAYTDEEITWTTEEGDDPIDFAELWYTTDGGETWEIIATGIEDTGNYTWTVPNEHSTDCLVRVKIYDAMGRTTEDVSQATFTIEGIPPTPPLNLSVEHYGFESIVLFEDDVEGGDLGYSKGTSEPGSEWSIRQHGATVGNNSWDFGDGEYYKTDDYGYVSWLISPEIEIPAEAEEVELSFAHWHSFGSWQDNIVDGANLKSATDGPDGNFSIIEPNEGYDGVIYDEYGNPLGGEPGWGGEGDWETVTFDLTPYIGETIHIRWDAGIEAYDGYYGAGWRIDNISITAEGIESDGDDHNILTWDASPDDPDTVSYYNIYRSEFSDGPWDESTLLNSVSADGSSNYSYVDQGKGAADEIYWWYVVRAVGENGLEEENTDAVQEPGDSLVTFEIELYSGGEAEGWNFVSFNLDVADTDLEAILVNIDGSYDRLMYFDSFSSEWLSYVSGREDHFNNLNSWDKRMGLWIRMISDSTLTVEGYVPVSTNIPLEPGWNMVGLPSESSGNHGLPGEVVKIGYFDASPEYNLAYDYEPWNFAFAPGEGYWLYNGASETVIWTVDY